MITYDEALMGAVMFGTPDCATERLLAVLEINWRALHMRI